VRGAGHGTRGPLLSRGILAMSCLPELARLALSLDNARVRRRAGRHGGLRDPRRPVVSAVATVREAPAVPADRVGSAAPMVAVPLQAANEAGLMSRMLVDPVVHDDCIAWTDADTARKVIALDEAARRADVLYLAECALKRDSAEGRPAGTGPGGPAGSVPHRFTDKPGECRCPTASSAPASASTSETSARAAVPGSTTAPAAPRRYAWQKRTSIRRRTKRPLNVHARGSSHQSAVRPNSQTVRSNGEEAESDDA
jgi:hypothetical protein